MDTAAKIKVYATGAAVTLVGFFVIRGIVRRARRNRLSDGNLDEKGLQARDIAQRLIEAHHWYNDNEEEFYRCATEMYDKGIKEKDVSDIMEAIEGTKLSKWLHCLDSEEMGIWSACLRGSNRNYAQQ